jgi:hypothetical protein
MFKKSLDDAGTEFELRAARLVLTGNRKALKRLYAHLTAAACMSEGSLAAEEMRLKLSKALLTPSRHVRWDTFSDL